jgi:two-component system, cell cycle response regulator
MKSEVKVLLLGFAPFEKSTFESFFRLVGRRDTLYKIVPDVTHAQVLMVNGDNPTAVQWASASVKSPQKAIYIGAPDPSGKWPTAPRPIKLTTVLGLLDVLVMADKELPAAPPVTRQEAAIMAPAPTAPAPVRVLAPVAAAIPVPPTWVPTPLASQQRGSVRQGSGGRATSNFESSNFLGISQEPVAASATQTYDDILVVDDSDVALKFMQNRLTRYGFRAELAKSGEEALNRVGKENFKFVFLDVMMEGLDGYQTCRAIKQRKYASGRAPVIVMLTSRGGSIDKIRGGLAGCDAYLTKPLNEAELLKVLSKYDEQVERSFRDTNLGGSGVTSY